MNESMWLAPGGARVRETLELSFEWCTRCWVVATAPWSSGRERGFWDSFFAAKTIERSVVIARPEDAEPELLERLHAERLLRVPPNPQDPWGNFLWFERDDEVRVLLASAPFEAALHAPGPWTYWSGSLNALPEGLDDVLETARRAAAPETLDELQDPRVWAAPTVHHSSPTTAVYSRSIPCAREVLKLRSTPSFFDLDADLRKTALWSALIGEGELELESAIRLAADRLRLQGLLEYQLLRQDGRVYGALDECLRAARREARFFDRPRSGFIRAIQPELEGLTAEQWRDCLMSALLEEERVDRESAVRRAFTYAQAVYGISARRLRAGGRADQALRSAINSSIRQGYLRRDGAAYLVVVAERGAPALYLTEPVEDVAPKPEIPPESTLEPRPPSDAAEQSDSSGTERDARGEEAASSFIPPGAPGPSSEPSEHHGKAPSRVSPTPSEPESAAPPAQGTTSPLDRELIELDFPTRTLNWAHREDVRTVRELVSWSPEKFAAERNVGRRTLRETREQIEALLGHTWEEAYAATHGLTGPLSARRPHTENDGGDSATELLTAGGPKAWVRTAALLSEEDKATPLGELRLSARMRNFVNASGIERVGELFSVPYSELVNQPNLGRKSLNDTLDAWRDFVTERDAPPAHHTFLEAWQAQLGALEPIPRMILTRRAGMHGHRETLEELGAMLGVSRERVRQIEARTIERFQERSRWRRAVDEHLDAAFGTARAVPLDLLAEDPWWLGIDKQELLLDFVIRRLFSGDLHVVEAPSGRRYLTKFSKLVFDNQLENVKSRVAQLEYPIERRVIEEILHVEASALDPVVFTEFEATISELLHVDAENPDVALGFGSYRHDAIVAFLNGQDEPVPVALIEERFGRGHFPDEVLYFKRGVIGLKRHFPDFDLWGERLVPAAVEVLQERPAGRQWLVPEIHEALREKGLIPDWLGHWHLASLLRRSGEVDYLGRLRVASKDSGQEQRIQYEELLEQILEEAGMPLAFDELLARARMQTDIAEGTANMLVLWAPLVRLDRSLVGLIERDVPGGPPAVAEAVEAIIERLGATERGLTPHQATVLVHALSDTHASWPRQLVISVLRNEAAIRIDRSKNIGLDAWDDVRCPTRPEFIRREVQRAGGTLSVRELTERLKDVYGRAPDRASLAVLVQQVGLTLSGEEIARPKSLPAEDPSAELTVGAAPTETDTANTEAAPLSFRAQVPGIPAELLDLFDELVRRPLGELDRLRAEVHEHLEAIEREHQVNEFIDCAGAYVLARQCHSLLDRWRSFPPLERHVAQAAVLYFVSWDDHENDLNAGGLDDDKRVMNAVLDYLGLNDEKELDFASHATPEAPGFLEQQGASI